MDEPTNAPRKNLAKRPRFSRIAKERIEVVLRVLIVDRANSDVAVRYELFDFVLVLSVAQIHWQRLDDQLRPAFLQPIDGHVDLELLNLRAASKEVA